MASLRGKVISLFNNAPVPGALVSLGGIATLTDAAGNFLLGDIPIGIYDLSIVHRDYEDLRQQFQLTGDSNIQFNLRPRFRAL